MAESTHYFDSIIADRAVLLDDQTALEGCTTVSLETQDDLGNSDVLTYIEQNFPAFLSMLRFLSDEDQELLLGYYVLAKTQATLALLHRSTQTLCSARLRMAMRKIGTFILLGPPTAASLRDIFIASGIEDMMTKPLSEIVELYAKTRSYQRVAEVMGLHRPEIRRVMSHACKVLMASSDINTKAAGAHVFDLTDKASASGQGFSRRKMAKQGDLYVTTPEILGEFRMSVSDPEFGQIFVSRANR